MARSFWPNWIIIFHLGLHSSKLVPILVKLHEFVELLSKAHLSFAPISW
jgi:hypothetical protein